MVDPIWLVLGLAAPALLALGLMALVVRPRPGLTPRHVATSWSVAVVSGCVVGWLATFGPPRVGGWFTGDGDPRWQDWLILLVAAAALVEAAPAGRRSGEAIAMPARVAIAIATPVLLLWPIIRHEWTAAESVLRLPPLAAGLLLLIACGRWLARSRPGREVPLVWVIASWGAAMTIALSGSQTIGQCLGSFGAAVLGATVLTWRLPRELAPTGVGSLPALVYGALLLIGYHYTYDPYAGREGLRWWNALLLTAATLAPCLAHAPPLRRVDRPWQRACLRLTLAALPVTTAAALAIRAFFTEPDDPYAIAWPAWPIVDMISVPLGR